MNCPVCENSLAEKTVESITVDVCEGGCGGIWFDNYEFEKVPGGSAPSVGIRS
ncbi:MAG: TFIIB-type zinc ribbon-containing protein [Planctomycetota bacterium]|jgi:Zn-finger nucleic acid-binding protein